MQEVEKEEVEITAEGPVLLNIEEVAIEVRVIDREANDTTAPRIRMTFSCVQETITDQVDRHLPGGFVATTTIEDEIAARTAIMARGVVVRDHHIAAEDFIVTAAPEVEKWMKRLIYHSRGGNQGIPQMCK